MKKQRLVVGISGSSGAILGIRLLEALRSAPVETHLILTAAARLTIAHETDRSVKDVLRLADFHYHPNALDAPLASGSFATMGMIVIPCSIKSLSGIANSYSTDLLTRAADVTLKEGRPLLLVVREAPLHPGHIRLMELAAQAGAVIFPPVPAFYSHPQSVEDIVDNIVGRVLNRIGIENDLYLRWQGPQPAAARAAAAQAAAQPDSAEAIEQAWSLPAMTLATTGADGTPHAAPVYFVADEGRKNLYFFSDAASQHSRDLQGNPRAAAAIHPPANGWQEIQGLQLRGSVRAVSPGEEWDQAWARYLVKFPFAGELKEQVARSTLYAFHLDWVRWVDNRHEFGYKEEWTQE